MFLPYGYFMKGNIMKKMTQMDKLRAAFTAGRVLTTKQISAQYRIASPRNVIFRLRNNEGLNIMTTETTNSKGQTTYKYQLGRQRAAA